MTDVFKAMTDGQFDVVEKALDENPALAKAANARGSTLLMGAAYKNNAALLERLVSMGADVNTLRAGGITALRFAVEQKHVAIAQRLLELGASAAHDEKPYDLLRFALNSGPALAIALIEHGLRLDIPHTDGAPILEALIEKTNVDAVRAYQRAGGALDVSRGRYSPIEIASRANQVEIIEFLIQHGATAEKALAVALTFDAVDVIAKLAHLDPKAVTEWLGDFDVKPVREALGLPVAGRGQLLSTAEAKAFIEARNVTLDAWWPHEFTEGRAILLPGGTTLESLELDFEKKLLGRDIKAGVIVDGDLTINGTLHNDEGDFGPFLVVLGNLTVKNVAIAGAPLHVAGDLKVENFHGFYNHGSTQVEGALNAGLFIAQDYGATLNGEIHGDIVEVRGHIRAKQKFTKLKASEVLAAEFLGEEDWPSDGPIAKALIAGKSIRK